ncbi:hypothetical protein SprV_0301328700 [Sparganum proliferum]
MSDHSTTTHATASAGTDALRNPGPVVRANSMGAGLFNRGRTLGIGCWNVRTFLDPGTQSLTARSLHQYKVDVCCLSEVRLPDSGSREIKIPGVESHFTLYHSGPRDSSGRHGVAIALSQQADLALPAWEPVNDRMAYVRLKGHFTNISIVAVYAPTSAAEQRDKEAFYSQLQALVERLPRRDLLIVAGDWNGRTGPGDPTTSHLLGRFGLGSRGENGERLLNFADRNRLLVTNTCFQHRKKHLLTWYSNDGRTTSQIDYIRLEGWDAVPFYVPSKLKLLRTNLGELAQRYFDALNLQKPIDLHTAFTKLESAWGGKDNVFLSRYRFCQMRQESNQCVSDFITNLTLAIQDCGYKEIKADNFEHAMLVQQLIVGLRNEKAQENLLSEKKDLSWEKACDIASNQERVRQNLRQLNQSNDGVIASFGSEMAVSLVNTTVSSPRQRPSAPSKQLLSCYRCGQHHIRWSDCRHQKTVCQFCKKIGHIERVCFSKRRANSNTHATYPNPAGDGEAILRMFSANALLQSPYTITLPVDHHLVKFEIDTGSAVTLINEVSLQKLPSLLPASSTSHSYTGQNVEVRGDLFRDDSATHYRGPPVKFQFQSDFRPRFFKARTVPYAVAPKVEEELDRLQKADIIEPVQYSEWAAPIVPVLKSDGSVRICGDYKLTINSATKLSPYPLPRIEDLYRITPNDSTGASPAELMFKRQLRTRLDLLNPSTHDRVIAKQTKMKARYDANTRPRVVAPNESVYTRLENETNWCPAVVRTSEGQIVEVELEDGRIVRRHLHQVRSRTDTVSGEFGKFELPETLDRDPDIPRTEHLLPEESITTPAEAYVPPPPFTPASISLGAEDPVTAQSGAEVENTALRGSTRIRKPVQRFQDESY